MTYREQFERLHPDIIKSFLQTGKSQAILEKLQQYILMIDRIPELQRVYPSVTRCAKALVALYPQFDLAFDTARTIIYDAINYFHLNSTVRNDAWNNYYADRAEELHQICVKSGDLKVASVYLNMAKEWRFNPNENAIDVSKLKPRAYVLSPEITKRMLGLKESTPIEAVNTERIKQYREAVKVINSYPINSEEKERLIDEAGLSYNITEAETE